jgi:ZIP family zinc transporter
MNGEATLDRLDDATIDIPYPWVRGEPVKVTLVSASGVTFTHEVGVAMESPRADSRYLSTFALLGIYVGVVPVFLGLLWLPFLRGVSRSWTDFFLSLTMGLLVFLGVDALAEAVEMSGVVASAFQGIGLVTLGVIGAPLLIEGVGRLRARGAGAGAEAMRAALLIALGIGLHNLGEGLAIGSSRRSRANRSGSRCWLGSARSPASPPSWGRGSGGSPTRRSRPYFSWRSVQER